MSITRVSTLLLLCANMAAGAQGLTATATSSNTGCSPEVEDIRLSALSGIMQIESQDQIMPALQKVLDRRDECSVTLRRRVVEMLGRSKNEQRVDILLRVARTDPSDMVKRQAIQSIGQVNTDRSAAALDSIVFNSSDLDITESALRALAQQTSPNARLTLHKVAEGTTLPIELRVRAVNALSSGRRTPDDQAYLLGLYGKTTGLELREAIMRSAANQHTPETAKWLLDIARDKSQETELRRAALRSVSQTVPTAQSLRSGTAGVELADLLALYDEMNGQFEMQSQLLDIYSQRSEKAATDKLLQIADHESNMELRRRAVQRLAQRRDPRVTEFLLGILSK